MAGHRRKRLYESFFRKHMPKGYRKHLSSSPVPEKSTGGQIKCDSEQSPTPITPLSEQRRRQNSETEFKRSYPDAPKKRKKSLLSYLRISPPVSPKTASTESIKDDSTVPLCANQEIPSSQSLNEPSHASKQPDYTKRTGPPSEERQPALDIQPCNFWEDSDAASIPPREKLDRGTWPELPGTSDVNQKAMDSDLVEERTGPPEWSPKSKQATARADFDESFDRQQGNTMENGQTSSVLPAPNQSRDTLSPPPPRRRVSISSSDSMAISSPSSDEDVIMAVAPVSPEIKDVPDPFGVSPLTYVRSDFFEPANPEEILPQLVHPILPGVEEIRKKSLVECYSNSFEEQPTMESNESLQQFMRLNEEHSLNLYVDDIQESTFDSIVASLYGNTSLKTVTIVRSSLPITGDYRTPKEMKCLWDAIRCLPNLKFLALMNLQPDVLPDLSEIMAVFRGHKFQMHMATGTVTTQFLKAMSRAPKLKQVQFQIHESADVGILLESDSILEFRIISKTFMFDEHHMQVFADRLARNESSIIEKIDLEPTLSSGAMLSIARALRHNKTLKSLQVSYNHCLGDCNAVVAALSKAIQSNHGLVELCNHLHESIWVNSDTKERLLKSLKANGKIEVFKFFQEDPIFWVAKEAVLKANRSGTKLPAYGIASIMEKYWSCGSLNAVNMGCDIRLPV